MWSNLVIQSLRVSIELPFTDRYWRRFTEIVTGSEVTTESFKRKGQEEVV